MTGDQPAGPRPARCDVLAASPRLPLPGRLRRSRTSCSRNQWTLPHNDDEPLFRTLNGVRDFVGGAARRPWSRSGWPSAPESSTPSTYFVDRNRSAGKTGGVIGPGSYACCVSMPSPRLAAGRPDGAGFASLGVLGLWDESMATLGLMLAAVILALRDRHSARESSPAAASVDSRARHADPGRDADPPDVRLSHAHRAPLLRRPAVLRDRDADLFDPVRRSASPRSASAACLRVRSRRQLPLGRSNRQLLTKVPAPLARRGAPLGVNQTILSRCRWS